MLPASSIDRRLLAQASKYATPEEMSEAVLRQLSPAECLERVKQILASKTTFDEIEERRLLLYRMAEWVDFMMSQRDNPQSWAGITRSLKVMSDQIERANINITDVSARLASEHATYFTEGYMQGFTRLLDELRAREVIEIPEEDVMELAEIGVEASSEYLDRVTVKAQDD